MCDDIAHTHTVSQVQMKKHFVTHITNLNSIKLTLEKLTVAQLVKILAFYGT